MGGPVNREQACRTSRRNGRARPRPALPCPGPAHPHAVRHRQGVLSTGWTRSPHGVDRALDKEAARCPKTFSGGRKKGSLSLQSHSMTAQYRRMKQIFFPFRPMHACGMQTYGIQSKLKVQCTALYRAGLNCLTVKLQSGWIRLLEP